MTGIRRGVFRAPLGVAALSFSWINTAATAQEIKHGGGSGERATEVVLALYDEDISWSDPYADIRTVYCKGPDCPSGSIHLPNVGREGHTFLTHIVERYDSLADWTVFSQAEAPSEGYLGPRVQQQRQDRRQHDGHHQQHEQHQQHHQQQEEKQTRGGHLLNGILFEDYLPSASSSSSSHGGRTERSKFFITSQVHMPTLRHSLRSTFKVSEEDTGHDASAQGRKCPMHKTGASDHWGSFQEMPELQSFLAQKCGIEESFLPEAMGAFWNEYMETPIPEGQILQYAQGARFAVSRKQILSRPKEFYQRLLQDLSSDVDPCFNYILEWAWYYVFEGSKHPCELTTLPAGQMSVRSLQEGGVSGETVTESVEAEQVSGNLDLSLGEMSANDFCSSTAALAGIESYLSELTGVPLDQVDAACADSRRLRRRLADSVSIVYTLVIIPDDTTSSDTGSTTALTASAVSAAITTAAADTSSMATSIATSLETAGVTVTLTVSDVSMPSSATVTVQVTKVVYPTSTTTLLDMSKVSDAMQVSATALVTITGDMAASDFCGRSIIQDAIVTFLQARTSATSDNIYVNCVAALGSTANLYITIMGSTLDELTAAYSGLQSLEETSGETAFATVLDDAIFGAEFWWVSATAVITSAATLGEVETTTTVKLQDIDGAPSMKATILPILAAFLAIVAGTPGRQLFG